MLLCDLPSGCLEVLLGGSDLGSQIDKLVVSCSFLSVGESSALPFRGGRLLLLLLGLRWGHGEEEKEPRGLGGQDEGKCIQEHTTK